MSDTAIDRRARWWLPAPAVTWERVTDIVVIGSGAAGLAAALAARPVRDVMIVTKDVLSAGSTAWAQGGLAGVLHPADTLDDHIADTLAAGAGLCDVATVRELVAQAPNSIRYLMRLGAAFDPAADGAAMALTREGGHSHDRIVHSGGDRSGAEVQRTLDESVLAAGVEVMEHAFALDLVMGVGASGRPQATGVRVATMTPGGAVTSVGVVRASAVVLATGGYGQVFASTSNPPAVTGDGLALALRAGLAVTDVEFVQFHPTVMWHGPDARDQQALVSEAVRGEGGVLYDAAGERIMAGAHPLEDLAPRDVVAAAISRRMAEAPAGVGDHVLLDATHLGERFAERFPQITASCRSIGIDPARDRIPVAPAAHYVCGGLAAGLDGVTELAGLYAVGEVACTGVHGANRLASNSLTESVVAGTWLGRDLAWELPDAAAVTDPAMVPTAGEVGLVASHRRAEVRAAMSKHAGVLRDEAGLDALARLLAAVATPGAVAAAEALVAPATSAEAIAGVADVPTPTGAGGDRDAAPSRDTWEATNLTQIASVVAVAARARNESRGCHRRSDFPAPDDAWLAHLDVGFDHRGEAVVRRQRPIAPEPPEDQER